VVFSALTRRLAGLAVPYISLADAKDRHAKRKPMLTQFDFEQIKRDWETGKISPVCRAWLDMMIITEAGTPVYTSMLTTLEDADRPEFADFKNFVLEVWNDEEEEHGACAMKVKEAIGFEFDRADVLHKDLFTANYIESCPPCARVLGTAAYTVIQEEITYWSHRAYAECSGSAELSRMGQVIAAEERYHSYFYASRLRDVLKVVIADGMPEREAFEIIATVVKSFVMPTRFHTIAYEKHVTPGKGEAALAYYAARRPAIRRQLGPIFMAAGGWDLVRAILNAGTPIGKFTEEEAKAEFAGA
jgi:hypothetical protein